MSYRLAKSLVRMREQFNTHAPGRNKASDGWIGDAAHARSTSDHNPWVKDGAMGIVTALDITHDPKNRVDTWAIAEHLRQHRDSRIKYVISNRRIFSSTNHPWTWRTYSGSNPHSSHVHVSVNSTKAHFDDARDWNLFGGVASAPGTPATVDKPILRRGSKGEAVRMLQGLLDIKTDGDFGPITENAVRAFQRKNDLVVDGVVGPRTWAALDKIEQIPMYYTAPRILSEGGDEEGE